MCWSIEDSTRGRVPIRFGTYNICNIRNGGLESALRGMYQANMDLGIFQETKITNGVYTHVSAGYSVITMDASIRHCGGVTVFYQPLSRFAVEAVHQFGPNVVGLHLATGERRWYIVGCYLAPDNTCMIESVVVALRERPRGSELLVAGDLNVKLLEPEGDWRGEEIAAALTTEGLEDMLSHSLLLRSSWFQDRRTRSMV